MRLTLVSAAAVLLLSGLAAGCGGSDDSSSDTTAADEWASDACSAVTTWTSELTSTVNELKQSGLSKDALQSAVDDTKSATETFVDDLKGLGKPDTEAGQEAKDAVDQLSTQLQSDVDKMESAAEQASGVSGVLSAVSVVSATLATMGSQLSSTFTQLQTLDAQGELKSAFDDSDSCKNLPNASGS
jgi:hypothetical protein